LNTDSYLLTTYIMSRKAVCVDRRCKW